MGEPTFAGINPYFFTTLYLFGLFQKFCKHRFTLHCENIKLNIFLIVCRLKWFTCNFLDFDLVRHFHLKSPSLDHHLGHMVLILDGNSEHDKHV